MKTLIDIIDLQNDFILADGACCPPGAPGLVLLPRFTDFFNQLGPQHADAVLLKFDTHFADEYRQSIEKQNFPHMHTPWGEKGQALAVSLGDLPRRLPLFYMNKNQFSMWEDNPTDISKVKFERAEEEKAYRNLFKVTPSFNDLSPGIARDEWMKQKGVLPGQTTIVSAGIYNDWCCRDGWSGYLTRGFNVIVLTDLCAGIGGHSERSGADLSGSVESVCQQAFTPQLKSGQLKLMTSKEWFAAYN